MIIIARQIEQAKSQQVSKDLNSILNEWKWGTYYPKNSQEFISKMSPWIKEKIKESKELAEFLKKKGVGSLSELNE